MNSLAPQNSAARGETKLIQRMDYIQLLNPVHWSLVYVQRNLTLKES